MSNGVPPITSWTNGVFTLFLVMFLGFVDHITGSEISFSIFYLLPISIAVWYSTRTMGYISSTVSATTWGYVEQIGALPYSQPWILYWNTGVRLIFFFVVAYLLSQLRDNLLRQKQLARTDALTGLLNRSGFIEHAGELVTLAGRHGHSMTIGFADLDGFKQVNDKRGHAAGDEVLRLVSSLFIDAGRGSDLVARFGGDEFVILLPHTGLPGAQTFFDKLRDRARDQFNDQGWNDVGLSIGAVVFENGPPDLGEALHLADSLMYRAKEPGSGGIIIESVTQLKKAG